MGELPGAGAGRLTLLGGDIGVAEDQVGGGKLLHRGQVERPVGHALQQRRCSGRGAQE